MFYHNLLSDEPLDKLPALFSDSATFASALLSPSRRGVQDPVEANKAVWHFFRENKELFLFKGIDPSMTLKKGKLNYVFSGFESPEMFFDGVFSIELIAPLSPGGKDGVFKQIRFPLESNPGPTGHRFLINATAITVNGVLIDLLNVAYL